ncbi:hypothetical protein BKA80DRAFT_62754 [Phyllosticta citrichinensis]
MRERASSLTSSLSLLCFIQDTGVCQALLSTALYVRIGAQDLMANHQVCGGDTGRRRRSKTSEKVDDEQCEIKSIAIDRRALRRESLVFSSLKTSKNDQVANSIAVPDDCQRHHDSDEPTTAPIKQSHRNGNSPEYDIRVHLRRG